jgi:hypothetical protein
MVYISEYILFGKGSRRRLPPDEDLLDVRNGSLADITAVSRHVRFSPHSGHSSVRAGCPLSAKSGLLPDKILGSLPAGRKS